MSIDRCMDKEDVIYMMEYYSVIEKNETKPFAAICMDREIIIPKWSKTEKDIKCYHLFVKSLKNSRNELC